MVGEKEECLTDRPRIKRLIEEHEIMKVTIGRLEPSISSLITAMDKLTEKVGDVHENHSGLDLKVEKYMSRLTGAIAASGALFGLMVALLSYIYITDQRATERHLSSMQSNIEKGIERDARGAAERELLFKALLKVIDSKEDKKKGP